MQRLQIRFLQYALHDAYAEGCIAAVHVGYIVGVLLIDVIEDQAKFFP